LLTHRQTNKLWQKHNLLGGGNKQKGYKATYITTLQDHVDISTK